MILIHKPNDKLTRYLLNHFATNAKNNKQTICVGYDSFQSMATLCLKYFDPNLKNKAPNIIKPQITEKPPDFDKIEKIVTFGKAKKDEGRPYITLESDDWLV